ncbi:unnamed protein product [Cunninghamella blakesleeana]
MVNNKTDPSSLIKKESSTSTSSTSSTSSNNNNNNNNNNTSPTLIVNNNKRSLQEEIDMTPPPKERKSRKAPHELLTEAEKKANHIASEQKRRQNIRLGFDQLIEIVPALNTGNRSEALILQKSVDHIKQLISVKNDLKDQIRDLQALLGESPYDEDSSEDDLTYSAY